MRDTKTDVRRVPADNKVGNIHSEYKLLYAEFNDYVCIGSIIIIVVRAIDIQLKRCEKNKLNLIYSFCKLSYMSYIYSQVNMYIPTYFMIDPGGD